MNLVDVRKAFYWKKWIYCSDILSVKIQKNQKEVFFLNNSAIQNFSIVTWLSLEEYMKASYKILLLSSLLLGDLEWYMLRPI